MSTLEPLLDLSHCQGTLSWHNGSLNIEFAARYESNCCIRIVPNPLSTSASASALMQAHRESQPEFLACTLDGRSSDGRTLATSSLWLVACNMQPSASGLQLLMELDCACLNVKEAAEEPAVAGRAEDVLYEYLVMGFRCFGAIRGEFDFGAVEIMGSMERSDDLITGGFSVLPNTGLSLEKIDAGADRVAVMLSIASGKLIRWSIRRTFRKNCIETLFLRGTPGTPALRPPLFPHNLQPFVHAAAANLTEALDEAAGLSVATSWMLAYSPHEEVCFLQRMTALEHLAHKFSERDKGILPADEFRRLQSQLIAVIDQFESNSTAISCADIREQIPHINSRNFKKKLRAMFAEYRVPLDGIEDWEDLIGVRNALVHTGVLPARGRLSTVNILKADLRLRELLVRIFLSLLSFDGTYRPWLGDSSAKHFVRA